MKFIILFVFSFLNLAHARVPSALLPKIKEALELQGSKSLPIIRPELALILNLIAKHEISEKSLDRWQKLDPLSFSLNPLPAPALKSGMSYPPLALHAHKFLVAEESDDVTNDDIYLSFFITDGWIPTGRVTSIYRGLDEGDSFLFNLEDRALFPVVGGLQIPRGQLIVDYMIIESDGDDITEMKRISGFITDLAIEYYRRQYGNEGEILRLREEVRLLSNALLDLDHDDRLVTSTWSPGPEEVSELFGMGRFAEVTRTHKQSSPWGDFKYKLTLRLIR